jgi:hypothetical protein
LEEKMASKVGNGTDRTKNRLPRQSVLGLWIDRLFVMDGIISLPIALIGFFILPDVPEISNPWYLSKQVCNVLPNHVKPLF